MLFLSGCDLTAQVSLKNFPRPCGIYALGTIQGGVSEIRTKAFVDGYVMRKDWTSIETSPGVYNWNPLDAVVKRLDSLGQGLTLDIFRMKVPQYILSDPNASTYTLTVGTQSFLTSLPWDSIANGRFEQLLDSVASHAVFSIASGTKVPLKNHPVLRQIDASPIGMNGIRDLYNQLTTLPAYSRPKLIGAIMRTARAVANKFPAQFSFVAIFGINDAISSSLLTSVIRDSLMRAFNRSAFPRMGFFQENLACATPALANNNTLYLMRDSTYTLNQMLQAWQNPFLNPSQTNSCISPSGGPDVGITYGLTAFKSTYCEVYAADLDYQPYSGSFSRIHDTLMRYCASQTITGIQELSSSVALSLFPNPTAGIVTLKFPGADRFSVDVLALGGAIIYSAQGHNGVAELNCREFAEGAYLVILTASSGKSRQKLIVSKE